MSIKHFQKQLQEVNKQHKKEVLKLQETLGCQLMQAEDFENKVATLTSFLLKDKRESFTSFQEDFRLLKEAKIEAESLKELMEQDIAEKNKTILIFETDKKVLNDQQRTIADELKYKMEIDQQGQF